MRLPPCPTIARTAATALGLALVMVAEQAPAAEDSRMAGLPAEQQEIAARMVAFIDRAERGYFDEANRLNGWQRPPVPETLNREDDHSRYAVKVIRGPVIEKLGSLVSEGKQTQPGRNTPPLAWGRFFSLDFHPRTPLVGMLHATLVLQFYEDGTGFAGGWLGVMNGTRIDADMRALTELVDGHFAEHGRDPAIYHRLMVKGTEDTNAEHRRQPDPAGVSFYGPPLFPGDVARSYALIESLFEKFTDAYLGLVVRHADASYSADDVLRQERMRKRWLIDQLFSDPFSSKLVPYEVWFLANVPPVIRF